MLLLEKKIVELKEGMYVTEIKEGNEVIEELEERLTGRYLQKI